jgi:hypothetical protein
MGVVLLWVAAGVSVAVGQARLGPYLVDSNGLKVGHVLDTENVLVFINGEASMMAAGRSGFTIGAAPLYFLEADCAGTPYQETTPNGSPSALNNLYPTAGLTSDGVIHYVSMASAAILMPQTSRGVNHDGSLDVCGLVGPGATYSLAPALTIQVPALTPPFHVVEFLPVSPAPATATFNDVPTTDRAFRFIEALSKSGITSGCQASPPLYCPDNTVTRREMAVFLAVALGL